MEILYSIFIGIIVGMIVGMIDGIVLQCRRDRRAGAARETVHILAGWCGNHMGTAISKVLCDETKLLPAHAFWFTRYLAVVPRPMPAAPIAVRRRDLIVVPEYLALYICTIARGGAWLRHKFCKGFSRSGVARGARVSRRTSGARPQWRRSGR